MWQLEQACKVQVLAQSTGQPIRQAPVPAIEKTAAMSDNEPVVLEWAWASSYDRQEGLVVQDIANAAGCVHARPDTAAGSLAPSTRQSGAHIPRYDVV